MTKLEDLGFERGIIVEALVTTFSKKGIPNIAPMGVIQLNSKKVKIRIFKTARTYKNILSKRCAIVNISSDISVFYKSTFKDSSKKKIFSSDFFEKGDQVDAPRLKSAKATVEIELFDLIELEKNRTEMIFEVKSIKADLGFPKIYCRAFSAVIEAIILATRIKPCLIGNKSQKKKASEMIEEVVYFKEIVNRTAPRSEYFDIIMDLIKEIESWKKK